MTARASLLRFVPALLLAGLVSCAPKGASSQTPKKGEVYAQQFSTEDIEQRDGKSQQLFIEGMGRLVLEDYEAADKLFRDALTFSPDNPAILYQLARTQMAQGQRSKAVSYASKSVENGPTFEDSYLLLAELHRRGGEWSKAEAAYSDLIAKTKRGREYAIEVGDYQVSYAMETDLRSREKEEYLLKALKTLDIAEKVYGPTEEIALIRRRAYMGLGQPQKALDALVKLVDSDPTNVRYRALVVEQLDEMGDPQKTIDFLELSLKAVNDPQIHLFLYDQYRRQGNFDEANPHLLEAFRSEDLDVDSKVRTIATFLAGDLSTAQQELAIELARETVQTHPEEAKAYSILGDALQIGNQKREARDAYRESLARDPGHLLVWQQVLSIDAELQDLDSLLVHSKQAIDLFPNQALLYYYRSQGFLMKGQQKEAIPVLERGRTLAFADPSLESRFNANLGDAYHAVGEYEKSDMAYESALRVNPSDPYVLNNYSYFLSLRGDKLEKAKRMAGQVVDRYPTEAAYVDTYAWVLYRMGDFKGAAKLLEPIAEASGDGTILEHYADALFQLGKVDEAVALWEKAKLLGGTSPEIDQKITNRAIAD